MVMLGLAGALVFWLSAARSRAQGSKLNPARAVPVLVTGRSELTMKVKVQFGPRRYSLDYRPEQWGARVAPSPLTAATTGACPR